MSKLAREHNIAVLFVAGDGLALMRLNHLLKSKRDIYMDMTPVIIPIQGAPRVLSASVFRLGFCAPPSPIFGPSVSTPGSSGGRAAGTPIANPFSEFFKVA
jgi:hypothetical protein